MPQVVRPTEDLFVFIPDEGAEDQDSWRDATGKQFDLYQSIFQFIPNDADFAESNLILGPELPDDAEAYVFKLGEPDSLDTIDQGMTIRLRLAKDAASGVKINALVELREEFTNEEIDQGTLRASATFEDISEDFTEFSFQVTPEEAADILDFTELSIRIVFTADYFNEFTNFIPQPATNVGQAYFETP